MKTRLIRRSVPLLLSACLGLTTLACQEDQKDLAPKAQELEEQKQPPAQKSQTFEVQTAKTKVTFEMDAELEKITGKAPESTTGELHVDLTDLSKTTGLVKIDLLDLTIYKQNRDSADEEFGEMEKNEKQNKDMRTWLQVSEDAPKDQREKFRYAEFKIKGIEGAAKNNVLEMKGAERKVDLKVKGSLRIHGRVTEHTFPAEAVFEFQGDEPKALHVTSKEPVGVSLKKHDVKPRKAFDVLADKTLDALGAKVAKVAEISLDVHAKAK